MDEKKSPWPMPKEYTGSVKPFIRDWTGPCALDVSDRSQDWRDGFSYAMSVVAFWLDLPFETDKRYVGMSKSALLGRLCRGEEVRRRPCPKHFGKMWCSWGSSEDMSCCDHTGWLPNEPTD